MRVCEMFTFAYCEITPGRVPFGERRTAKKFTVHTHTHPGGR